MKNTAIIIANRGSVDGNDFAATVCNEYAVTVDGVAYGDWYLPSKYELDLPYINRIEIGGFGNSFYWSSTEIDNQNAWRQHFVGMGMAGSIEKASTSHVRAVRAF